MQYRSLEEALQVGNIPLPEMTYAQNFLRIQHEPSGINLSFTPLGALRSWHKRQKATHGVAPASSTPACSLADAEPTVDVTRYDWTYTNDYDGDVTISTPLAPETDRNANPVSSESHCVESSHQLPLDLLQRRGAILYFADVPLYASDLNDRGIVECGVKIRVMQDCFLVLLRSYQRLDRERVWLRDVRWCHKFGDSIEALTSTLRREASTSPCPPGGEVACCPHPMLLMDVQVRQAPMALLLQRMGVLDQLESILPSFLQQPNSSAPVVQNSAATGPPASQQQPQTHSPQGVGAAAAQQQVAPGSPGTGRVIHPVVLESMRARAARQGLRVADDGTLLTAHGTPVDSGGTGGDGGGGVAGGAYAARFVPEPASQQQQQQPLRGTDAPALFTDRAVPAASTTSGRAASPPPAGADDAAAGASDSIFQLRAGPSRLGVSADEVYEYLRPNSKQLYELKAPCSLS